MDATTAIARVKKQAGLRADLREALQTLPQEEWSKVIFIFKMKGLSSKAIKEIVGRAV